MEFIRNKKDESPLQQLCAASVQHAESIVAAIAYATDTSTLLDDCWKACKPLTLYVRYDYSGPVSDSVFRWFLKKGTQSSNYELRLVADIFHPKVIWWKGVGAYIGSANLTSRAWAGNLEAGIFLTEEELDESNMRESIESFFDEVRSLSHPLTQEIADEMVKAGTGRGEQERQKAEFDFNKTRLIQPQLPLNSLNKPAAKSKNRGRFLKEWDDTLQHLRALGNRLALPENRPSWLPPGVPEGVLADQFLHAYYYNRVRDGSSYPYRELFKTNSENRDAAVRSEFEWWKNERSAPSREDTHIIQWAPEARRLLSQKSIEQMSVTEFQELCLRIHAVREHAKRVSTTTFGLHAGIHRLVGDSRVKEFAKWLYGQKSQDGSSSCEVIHYVLYGGPKGELANRIYESCFETRKKIPHLGVSSLGEMAGWAMPNDFPPRNGRTSKALMALGYEVTIHSE